ncbi:MAG: RcnB family protein [Sphingobium sp.]
MKKFILAAVAASLISTPVLAAPMHQPGPQDRGRIEQNDRHPQAQNWKKGDRFDTRKAPNYRVIDNPRAHHLNDAPRGYRWVQSGNDAVLVGIASGLIAAVLANSVHY